MWQRVTPKKTLDHLIECDELVVLLKYDKKEELLKTWAKIMDVMIGIEAGRDTKKRCDEQD